MGDLIKNSRFHQKGTWLWAMRQVALGYKAHRRSKPSLVISSVGDWSITSEDALAEDWEILLEPPDSKP